MVQLNAGHGTHQHQGVDREMRIELQWHAVAPGITVEIQNHVAALGRNGRRGGVAGGLEHTAEQDRDVDQLAVGLLTDCR
ncbi:hypothetical protein D3C87_1189600 [compost metagenome]